MRNKIIVFALSIALLMGIGIPVHAEETPAQLTISTVEEFIAFAENCRQDSYSQGLTVTLENNINLEGFDFNPIPIFSGSFEGNGHTISGVSVESDGSFHSINLPPYMYATIRGRVSNGTGLNFEVYDNRVDIRTRSYSAGVWYTDYNYSIPLV